MKKTKKNKRLQPSEHVRARTLRKLTAERKEGFAQQLLLHEICNGSDWCHNITETRGRVMNLANRLSIEPNVILSILDDLLHPEVKKVFEPFSLSEVRTWEDDTTKLQQEVAAWGKAHKAFQKHRHEPASKT